MCGISAIRTDMRVAVQARGGRNLVEGNLAAAVLADSNLVVVPNPPRALLDDSLAFDVWVIPVPVTLDKTIEVLAPLKKNFLAMRSHSGAPTAAYVELTHHSMYASQIARCDGRELGDLLESNGGDMWAALVGVGAIPAELGEDLSPATLLAAEKSAQEQRRPRRSDMEFASYQELGAAFCWPWVCFCSDSAETRYGALATGRTDETSA
jgi:hypothetical protein